MPVVRDNPGGTLVTRNLPEDTSSGGTISSSDIGTVDAAWKSGGPTGGTGAWGPVGNPQTDFVELRYDSGTGSSGFIKIEGSGDTDAFYLMSMEGDNLDTPQTFQAITNNSDHLYVAWKGTASGKYNQVLMGLKPIYTDGTAKTLNLEFFDHEGNSVGTLSASGTVADPFQSAVEAPGLSTVIGLWSAENTAAGALASGDTSFRNIYSPSPYADDLKAYKNGDRSPAVGNAVTSYDPQKGSSGFTNGTLSGEVYVDIPASAAVAIWSNTYWNNGVAKLDSLGTNDSGAITSDMEAWFMVIKNNRWIDANNTGLGWNSRCWAGGAGCGNYPPSYNTYEPWYVLLEAMQHSGVGNVGYGRAGLYNTTYGSNFTGTYIAVNDWMTVAVMRNPAGGNQFKWWLSEVGQPFGNLYTPSSWWSTYNPTDRRTWGVWHYGQWSNTVDATRLSCAAVAAWDTSWDESATNHFANMHAQVT